jgi:hypothetical protein
MSRNDKVVFVVVLLVLFVVGASVFVAARRSVPAGPVLSPQAELREEAVAGIAPFQRLLDGFVLTDSRPYTSEDLYEYIDGQAPRYIQFGFKGLTVAEYAPASESQPELIMTLVVDLYDMGLRRNAFGIFHDSRPPEDEALAIGNAGYGSGDFVAFWKGPYYVRVSALSESDPGGAYGEIVRAAAGEIAGWIVDPLTTLAEFDVFPKEGLLPEGLSFEKDSALGLSYLSDVFVADYQADGASYRLFYSRPGSDVAAARVVESQIGFLHSGGKVESAEGRPTGFEVWGSEKYMGPMLLIRDGTFIAGSIGIADPVRARKAVRDLLERVRELPPDDAEESLHAG